MNPLSKPFLLRMAKEHCQTWCKGCDFDRLSSEEKEDWVDQVKVLILECIEQIQKDRGWTICPCPICFKCCCGRMGVDGRECVNSDDGKCKCNCEIEGVA